jgi:hypothetical protein
MTINPAGIKIRIILVIFLAMFVKAPSFLIVGFLGGEPGGEA